MPRETLEHPLPPAPVEPTSDANLIPEGSTWINDGSRTPEQGLTSGSGPGAPPPRENQVHWIIDEALQLSPLTALLFNRHSTDYWIVTKQSLRDLLGRTPDKARSTFSHINDLNDFPLTATGIQPSRGVRKETTEKSRRRTALPYDPHDPQGSRDSHSSPQIDSPLPISPQDRDAERDEAEEARINSLSNNAMASAWGRIGSLAHIPQLWEETKARKFVRVDNLILQFAESEVPEEYKSHLAWGPAFVDLYQKFGSDTANRILLFLFRLAAPVKVSTFRTACETNAEMRKEPLGSWEEKANLMAVKDPIVRAFGRAMYDITAGTTDGLLAQLRRRCAQVKAFNCFQALVKRTRDRLEAIPGQLGKSEQYGNIAKNEVYALLKPSQILLPSFKKSMQHQHGFTRRWASLATVFGSGVFAYTTCFSDKNIGRNSFTDPQFETLIEYAKKLIPELRVSSRSFDDLVEMIEHGDMLSLDATKDLFDNEDNDHRPPLSSEDDNVRIEDYETLSPSPARQLAAESADSTISKLGARFSRDSSPVSSIGQLTQTPRPAIQREGSKSRNADGRGRNRSPSLLPSRMAEAGECTPTKSLHPVGSPATSPPPPVISRVGINLFPGRDPSTPALDFCDDPPIIINDETSSSIRNVLRKLSRIPGRRPATPSSPAVTLHSHTSGNTESPLSVGKILMEISQAPRQGSTSPSSGHGCQIMSLNRQAVSSPPDPSTDRMVGSQAGRKRAMDHTGNRMSSKRLRRERRQSFGTIEDSDSMSLCNGDSS